MLDNKSFCFSLDREGDCNLTEQLVGRLREDILSGRCERGTILPPRDAFARQLGVSEIVIRRAVRKLVEEGLVVTRPRIGAVVAGAASPAWRGHVLVVTDGYDGGYYGSVMLGTLHNRLLSARYLFTHVAVNTQVPDRRGLEHLMPVLARKYDLALLVFPTAKVQRLISEAGIPYVVLGHRAERLPKLIGKVRFGSDAGIAPFVAHCVRAGIRAVTQVCFVDEPDIDAGPQLSRAGIRVRRCEILPGKVRVDYLGVKRAAFETLEAELRSNALPDLFFFTDDFIAAGGLLAFPFVGVRIPEDVKVVSLSNRGFGPFYPRVLTRLEMDPVRHGEELAAIIGTVLENGEMVTGGALESEYLTGDSFPD